MLASRVVLCSVGEAWKPQNNSNATGTHMGWRKNRGIRKIPRVLRSSKYFAQILYIWTLQACAYVIWRWNLLKQKKMKSSETIIDQLTVQLERDRERERDQISPPDPTHKKRGSLSVRAGDIFPLSLARARSKGRGGSNTNCPYDVAFIERFLITQPRRPKRHTHFSTISGHHDDHHNHVSTNITFTKEIERLREFQTCSTFLEPLVV